MGGTSPVVDFLPERRGGEIRQNVGFCAGKTTKEARLEGKLVLCVKMVFLPAEAPAGRARERAGSEGKKCTFVILISTHHQ